MPSPLVTLLFATLSFAQERAIPEWTVLRPTSFLSEKGASHEVLEDSSLLIPSSGGGGEESDRHTFEFKGKIEGMSGIRLEALPHESLPSKGPGGADNGNFVMTRLEVLATSEYGEKYSRVEFDWLAASHEQGDWPASGLVDQSPKTGWAILPKSGASHELVIQFREPMSHRGGTKLRVICEYAHGSKHVLRRLRVSATNTPKPFESPALVDADELTTLVPAISESIARGVRWLLSQQKLDGSLSYHQSPYLTGQTALAVYTMIKCGLPENSPSIQRGLEFIKTHPPTQTYSAACQVMAFTALSKLPSDVNLKGMGELILSWNRNGGFSYPSGSLDLSNTQYACLALHLLEEKGVIRVPREVWEEIEASTLGYIPASEVQTISGAFLYRNDAQASASMTAAGIVVATLCELHLPRLSREMSDAKARAIAWLGRYLSVSSNVVPGAPPANRWLYYYLYGLERVGGLTELSHFGPHDWYFEGSRFLVSAQKKEGSWASPSGEDQPNTCFALLFLSKATAPSTGSSGALTRTYRSEKVDSDIVLRGAGDAPLSLWIEDFGKNLREDFSWPGEKDRGLRVGEVTYMASRDESFDDEFLIGEVGGDDERPHGFERFAMQHSFSRPGAYWVRAAVILSVENEDREIEFETILSDALKVEIDQAVDPRLVEYASDGGRNLLTRSGATATASSELNDGWKASNAVDNLLGNGWLSSDGDLLPSITIDLKSAVSAQEIVLTHSVLKDRPKRIYRIRARVNERKTLTYEFSMVSEDWTKTTFKLPKKVRVRRLEIEVLETLGSGEKGGVGLAEIEIR